MKTEKTVINRTDGEKPLNGLLWGNNAAWICKCGELLGERTGTIETQGHRKVQCAECQVVYEISSHPNKNGRLHLGRAKAIKIKKWAV